MSNGFLLASGPDLAAARELSIGFGLEVIDADAVRDAQALGDALAQAANVGIIISAAASGNARFVALMRQLGARLQAPQLILTEREAYAPFAFLPSQWPAMLLEEARSRASRRREASPAPTAPPASPRQPAAPSQGGVLDDLVRGATKAAPGAATPPQPPAGSPPQPDAQAPEPPSRAGGVLGDLLRDVVKPDAPTAQAPSPQAPEAAPPQAAPQAPEPAPPASTPDQDKIDPPSQADAPEAQARPEPAQPAAPDAPPQSRAADAPGASQGGSAESPAVEPAPAQEPSRALTRPEAPAPEAPEHAVSDSGAAGEDEAHEEAAFEPLPQEAASAPPSASGSIASRPTAPADATAFAPKKLRRSETELVRIVVHQPSQLRAVIKAARRHDPNARPAPQGISIGDIALGANVGIALEVRGARCEGALQRRSWAGEPIDFSFPVDADDDARQAVFLARVFVDDAQIGVIAFTRPIVGAKRQAPGGEVRLKRHKRVFLSYASADRETVSAIATAYQMAGVAHFWDRASLKGGEEWGPRLRKEIDRADLFHLCWSKAAAQSEWVAKEAEHALKRKQRAKSPEITVQMLDGPPWAPHPPELAAINFDDFVRAAIVGYARGEA